VYPETVSRSVKITDKKYTHFDGVDSLTGLEYLLTHNSPEQQYYKPEFEAVLRQWTEIKQQEDEKDAFVAKRRELVEIMLKVFRFIQTRCLTHLVASAQCYCERVAA
jgi:hypothetical protein